MHSRAGAIFCYNFFKNEFSESDCRSKQFVRALTLALCRSCMIDSKVDPDLFKLRGPILSKFIARNESLEVESLFGVQALDFQTKHQPG